MKAHKSTLSLSNADISSSMEMFENILRDTGLGNKDVLGLSLSMEEILLRWQDHFGVEKQITLNAFQRMGHMYICLSVAGEKYNPLEGWDEAEDLVQRTMKDRGLSPTWEYRKNTNHVWIRPKKQKKNPMLKLLLAILAALLLGVGGHSFFPEFTQQVVPFILTPVRSVMFGMLSAVAVPLIFLSVVLGICSVGDKSTFNLIGKKVVSRFLGIGAVVVVVFGVISFLLFSIHTSGIGVDTSQFGEIIRLLLNIFPQNLFEPFVSGNTLQLIVLAVAVGLSLLLMGSRASTLVRCAEQLSDIIKTLLGWISSMMPLMIFLVLLEMVWNGRLGSLINIWKPLILYLTVAFGILSLRLLLISRRYRLSIARLLKLMMPTLMIGLSTSSSSVAFSTNLECCERDLGVHKKVSRIGVPLGTVIFSPVGSFSFLLISMYCAGQFRIECSVTWLVIAIISSFLLKSAAPPVGGGNIACYTILFLQLGIPESAMAIAVTMDILLDRISAVCKLGMMQLELIAISDKLEMLDRESLSRNAGRTGKT